MILRTSLVLFAAGACYAQNLPSFEVAAIKPAAPMGPGMRMIGMRGGPGTPDPGRMTFTNVSLKDVIQNAWDIRAYQVSGPEWLESERFDITATLPAGTTKEQSKLMLQSLLAERFKLTLHHSTKELPLYALVVAKNGSKLKEATGEPAPPAAPGGPGGYDAPVPPGKITLGKDGFPQLPPGAGKGGAMMMVSNGRMRIAAKDQTMARFVDMLAMQVDLPVVDSTGLQGKYDITLDFAPDQGRMQSKMAALGAMAPPGANPAPGPDADNGPTLFAALTEQLGLKLESRKGPVDLLVIDHVEKVPTGN